MNNITYIYALVDPICNNNSHIYIGKSDDPYIRYYQHLKDKCDTYKCRWIKKLINNGFTPDLQILECCDIGVWQEKEKEWISFYKKIKYNIVNGMDGGMGGVASLEVRRKMKKTHTGMKHSEETIKKMQHPHKSYDTSFLTKEYRKEKGNKRNGSTHSEETIKKMMHKHKSYDKSFYTDEYRKKLNESRKGRIAWNKGVPMPEKTRLAIRKSRLGFRKINQIEKSK